jgi:hypothetical protein
MAGKDWTVCLPNEKEKKKKKGTRNERRKTKDETWNSKKDSQTFDRRGRGVIIA